MVEGGAGRVGRGARQLLTHEGVGEEVLDGLEGADRAPELLAALGVGGRQLLGRLGDPEQLRGDQRSAFQPQPLRDGRAGDALALGKRGRFGAAA